MDAVVAVGTVAVVAAGRKLADEVLVQSLCGLGFDATIVTPAAAVTEVGDTDVALVRLDVLQSLEGIEPGLAEVRRLEALGRRVVNGAHTLVAAHDKLVTARLLAAAGLPHPRTVLVGDPTAPLPLEAPLVVKPRFGSWGRDVFLCETAADARACLAELAGRGWFRSGGALLQEPVRSPPTDLRVIVADGRVVGAARRTAGPGQWRTNISLGGRLSPAEPSPEARELALAAAGAIGAGLVGVDLLLGPDGSWTVLELNGSVDFDGRYSIGGADVYAELVAALGLVVPRRPVNQRTHGCHPSPARHWSSQRTEGEAP